jgi:quercetin dioxygenase-like cupin family protein
MTVRRIFTQALLMCLFATAVLFVFKFTANATPPSGLSFTPVGRATIPAFSVKRKIKALDWEMELEADQPIDVATQIVTFQPGGYSGWHTHPGLCSSPCEQGR